MIKIDWKDWATYHGLFGITLSEIRCSNTSVYNEENFWLVSWYLGNLKIWTSTEPWGYRRDQNRLA